MALFKETYNNEGELVKSKKLHRGRFSFDEAQLATGPAFSNGSAVIHDGIGDITVYWKDGGGEQYSLKAAGEIINSLQLKNHRETWFKKRPVTDVMRWQPDPRRGRK